MNHTAVEELYKISTPVKQVPVRERPRELFDRFGADGISDAALIAIILRSGVRGRSVIELSAELLHTYGSLTELARLSVDELAAVRGMGHVKAQVLKSALELAGRMAAEKSPDHPKILSPADAAAQVRATARASDTEIFWVLLLDTKNRVKRHPVEVSRGLLDSSLVHPREVFREAIRSSSAAVILLHNHPSGDPTPSQEDISITKQLVEAGKIISISVLDHVILGQNMNHGESDFISLREAGLVEF